MFKRRLPRVVIAVVLTVIIIANIYIFFFQEDHQNIEDNPNLDDQEELKRDIEDDLEDEEVEVHEDVEGDAPEDEMKS